MARSFLKTEDLSSQELMELLKRAGELKQAFRSRNAPQVLDKRIIGILFEKPSTRTRTSFESAVIRLGGSSIYLSWNDLQMKRGEPVRDTARMLGAYVDGLIARVYEHQTLEELARYAGVAVLNALSDLEHPTQAVCDLFTILEVRGRLEGVSLAYIGDGNNVCHSLLVACALAGVHMNVACPPGYEPDPAVLSKALNISRQTGTRLAVMQDPREAARNCDILYTDVWISMGEEEKEAEKQQAFQAYQINRDLLALAADDAFVMHCLPAYRGQEITEEVLEGPRSVVWQQGENKMHAAGAILERFLR